MVEIKYYNANGAKLTGPIPTTDKDGNIRVFPPTIRDGGELKKRLCNHMFGYAVSSHAIKHGGGKGKIYSARQSGESPWEITGDEPISEQTRRQCLCGCGRYTQPTDDSLTWKLFIEGHETRDFFPGGN